MKMTKILLLTALVSLSCASYSVVNICFYNQVSGLTNNAKLLFISSSKGHAPRTIPLKIETTTNKCVSPFGKLPYLPAGKYKISFQYNNALVSCRPVITLTQGQQSGSMTATVTPGSPVTCSVNTH